MSIEYLVLFLQKERTAHWVSQTATNAPGYSNPTKAVFMVILPPQLTAMIQSVSDASGTYVFDRENIHGPVFRHSQDRRWKLAKGALKADYKCVWVQIILSECLEMMMITNIYPYMHMSIDR